MARNGVKKVKGKAKKTTGFLKSAQKYRSFIALGVLLQFILVVALVAAVVFSVGIAKGELIYSDIYCFGYCWTRADLPGII